MHKITKISTSDNPQSPTASSVDAYRNSLAEDIPYSPCVDYWVVGEILKGPFIGCSLVMDRWVRNGILTRGTFSTSRITSLTEDGFKTMNSVYKLEEVDEETILELTSGQVGA